MAADAPRIRRFVITMPTLPRLFRASTSSPPASRTVSRSPLTASKAWRSSPECSISIRSTPRTLSGKWGSCAALGASSKLERTRRSASRPTESLIAEAPFGLKAKQSCVSGGSNQARCLTLPEPCPKTHQSAIRGLLGVCSSFARYAQPELWSIPVATRHSSLDIAAPPAACPRHPTANRDRDKRCESCL